MSDNDGDANWAEILSALAGAQPKTLSGIPKNPLIPPLLLPVTDPRPPATTTSSQMAAAEERFQSRLRRLNEVAPVALGRVIPDADDLTIGGARRLNLAVLFLDICHFSQIDSGDETQQNQVLKLLNVFMSEMLHIIRHYSGVFEKNTGDGLMAYFGEPKEADSTQRAVDAAVTMHCYNDHVISPNLTKIGLPVVRFRVGIDAGLVTVANVGVRGDHRSLVAIGNVANIARKLMTMIPEGGIVVGSIARGHLSMGWQNAMAPVGALPGFVFKGTSTPYSAWELTYRAPNNSALFGSLLGIR